ncbi:MAG: hypothetical protein H6734_11935 [Alphaproteobacteria bacterium]|nr:hypothetical protein [Alphaproteobacteria bacterium]
MTPPTHTLALYDTEGELFGHVRIAPDPDREGRLDCIFDVAATHPAQNLRSEVRWLLKRHYEQMSEHRFELGDDGSVRISKADFVLWLDPGEEEDDPLKARAPSPGVTADWIEE